MTQPLITPTELAAGLGDHALTVVDCRFDLAQPAWGDAQYPLAHIPGAVYAHLDRDLSGAKTGSNGRHPLPEPADFRAAMSRLGIGPGVAVVAYDQADGMWASRLWWLLRYYGHAEVRVLDGGLARWQAEGRPTVAGVEARPATRFVGAPQPGWIVEAVALQGRWMNAADRVVIDARAVERYRGEVEPIDRVAGHIPGAVNQPYKTNVDADGRFLAPNVLRARYAELLAGRGPEQVVNYCGSGVSACHNILAMTIAGLPGARLYPGSWSEWSSDEARPVARF
ncbi:MAG: sulfurtransferase [Anaerolineales bacterium]|nr:sulfurtransferase [Anaerolineales bacterium]